MKVFKKQAQRHKGTKAQSNKGKNSVFLRLSALVPNKKGLTLLEIAISLAILAIALVALANLFPVGLRASRRAMDYSSASILAQRVIENIKRATSVLDYDDPEVDPRDIAFIDPDDWSDEDDIGYFELVNYNVRPFNDQNVTITHISSGVDKYEYDGTDMDVCVTRQDWNANGNLLTGRTGGDWDDVLLSQKIYVAIYWTEADKDRAETFITYISNPFYEKYR